MSELATYAQNHVDLLKSNDYIDPALYEEYGVKYIDGKKNLRR